MSPIFKGYYAGFFPTILPIVPLRSSRFLSFLSTTLHIYKSTPIHLTNILSKTQFSPEREYLESTIPQSQKTVNGQVRLRLYRGKLPRHRHPLTNHRPSLNPNHFLQEQSQSSAAPPRPQTCTTSPSPRWTRSATSNPARPVGLSRCRLSG